MVTTVTAPAVLLEKYLDRSRRDPISGCAIYGRHPDRYARLRVGRRTVLLHRLIHGLAIAERLGLPHPLPVPPGIVIRHVSPCTARACGLPEHLRAGTYAENSADMIAAGNSMRGTKNARAKLAEADVRRIRSAPRTHAARHDLADELGVHVEHVRAVQDRRVWGWLA